MPLKTAFGPWWASRKGRLVGHLTDNMNDLQHTELNSIKVRNSGGAGWVLSEFGHMMRGDVAVVRCIRFNAQQKVRRTVEYEIDQRGVSKLVLDDQGPVA
jgi:hypothetical protein